MGVSQPLPRSPLLLSNRDEAASPREIAAFPDKDRVLCLLTIKNAPDSELCWFWVHDSPLAVGNAWRRGRAAHQTGAGLGDGQVLQAPRGRKLSFTTLNSF